MLLTRCIVNLHSLFIIHAYPTNLKSVPTNVFLEVQVELTNDTVRDIVYNVQQKGHAYVLLRATFNEDPEGY